ncbi:2864_t:CDS:2 [Racocetra fulgida]|uniref:2864_t:CDS:1 n=1 Tax=Racocetra fulgida TaxID=60492 RepID=A0A9N9E6V7_9GLOM|nr:2864_t:CDS:2 [Racocetra fulgida]
MPRFSHYEAALGSQLFEKIKNCRVLMVGAGGIGCELLKNLVMSGFNQIELVARESALKFNPNANIVAHHANIKDPRFSIEWFKSFDIVMNALDNLEEELDKELNDENADEIANLKAETLALKRIKEAIGSQDYPKIVFQKIFNDDINRLLTMEDMWKTRKPPVPLVYEEIEKLKNTESQSVQITNNNTLRDQRLWTTNPDASLVFDKDDIDAMDFVTATSNLRARIFGIEEKTRFQVKAMAGNIIPAIATTNAIVAGMIVMQAFKVLNGDFKECKTVYCSPDRRPKSILSESLNKPNPECSVCQSAHVTLNVNVKTATLRDFLKEVVQGHDESENDICEVSVEEGGRIIYDVEYDDNLDATFEKLNITDGKMVKVTPEGEDEEKETFESPNTWFHIDGDIAPRFRTYTNSNAHKRKLDDSEVDPQEESSRKRPAVIENEVIVQDDDLIMTEDGPQRLIIID